MQGHEMTGSNVVAMAFAVAAWVIAAPIAAQAQQAQPGQPQVVYVQPQPAAQPVPQPGQPQVVYVQAQPYGQQAYGQPVAAAPMGTPHTRERPNLGLIIPGAVMLGVGWIMNFIVGLPAGDDPFSGGSSEEWDAFRLSSLIPVAGPWVQLGVKPTDFRQDYWPVWLIFDGVLQAAGTLMLIIGIATPGEETYYADVGGGLELAFAPSVGPGHTGLVVEGRF